MTIVNKETIFALYEHVYHDHETDEERFKAVQEQTGAGLGCIRQVVGDAHEEGRE